MTETPQDTLARLSEIVARNEARTQGAWRFYTEKLLGDKVINLATILDGYNILLATGYETENEDNDFAFIAAASRDIPALLALVRWQGEEIDTLREKIREATK